jgi:hypothetical protein
MGHHILLEWSMISLAQVQMNPHGGGWLNYFSLTICTFPGADQAVPARLGVERSARGCGAGADGRRRYHGEFHS